MALLLQGGDLIEEYLTFMLGFYNGHTLAVSQWALMAHPRSVGHCANLGAWLSCEQQNPYTVSPSKAGCAFCEKSTQVEPFKNAARVGQNH